MKQNKSKVKKTKSITLKRVTITITIENTIENEINNESPITLPNLQSREILRMIF